MSSGCKGAFCSLWNGTTFKISKNYMYTTTSTGNTCILPQPLEVYAYYHSVEVHVYYPSVEVHAYYHKYQKSMYTTPSTESTHILPKHWKGRYTNYHSHWKSMSTSTSTGRAIHPSSQRWVILTHFILAQKHAVCSEDYICHTPKQRFKELC